MSAQTNGQQSSGFDAALRTMKQKYGVADAAPADPPRPDFDAETSLRAYAEQFGADPDLAVKVIWRVRVLL